MIRSISISNLGVISQAELHLTEGFNVITGETGAGKTMLLSAMQLLLGERADSSRVREGANQLRVSGQWDISNSELIAQVDQLGGEIEQSELFVTRTVSSDGRSKAVLGGAPVPLSSLSGVAEQLVVIHGQSDQARLRSQSAQRNALDAFGGDAVSDAKSDYQSVFKSWQESKRRLLQLEEQSKNRDAEILRLKSFIADMEQVAPMPDELDQISQRLNRLENVESLRAVTTLAHDAISSENSEAVDALSLISDAKRLIDSLAGKDEQIAEIGKRLSDLSLQFSEVSADLSRFIQDLDADPSELDKLQHRKSDLVALERRYGLQLAHLIPESQRAANQLLDLEDSDNQLEILEQHIAELESQLLTLAAVLTEKRGIASTELARKVSEELNALAMPNSEFSISLKTADFEIHGADMVYMLLAAYPGAEPRPIGKSASGGELSRLMLAIEVVLAGSTPTPTMIFDEVDAGVGGASAIEIGKRLKRLSRDCQVIVVTHLPQVAAFADNHLLVQKHSSDSFVASDVGTLLGAERTAELARMLGGMSQSESARAHAKELIETAKTF